MSDEAPDSEPCGPAVYWGGIRQNCDCGVWDLAFVDQSDDTAIDQRAREKHAESFADGADWMARWIAGLIGMAEAIRQREAERPNRDLARWYDQHLAEQAAFSAAHMQYAQNAAAGIAQHVNARALENQCTRGEDLFASIVSDSWLTGRKK